METICPRVSRDQHPITFHWIWSLLLKFQDSCRLAHLPMRCVYCIMVGRLWGSYSSPSHPGACGMVGRGDGVVRTGGEPLQFRESALCPWTRLPSKTCSQVQTETIHDIIDREPPSLVCLKLKAMRQPHALTCFQLFEGGGEGRGKQTLEWNETSFSRTFFHWSSRYTRFVS